MKVIDDADGKEIELRETSVKLFIDNIAPKVSVTPDKDLSPRTSKAIASIDYKYAVTADDGESGVASILVRVDGKGDFMAYKEPIAFTHQRRTSHRGQSDRQDGQHVEQHHTFSIRRHNTAAVRYRDGNRVVHPADMRGGCAGVRLVL